MTTAADGAYEGGAGGKFRRKPLRRAATPYDRPPSAIRNSSEAERNGWLLKLVDPASRIITRGAQRLFSSVFRKGLPAPPTVSETNHEPQPRDELPVAVSFNSSGAQDKVSNEGNGPADSSNAENIDELEKILKQKTFTREEIDRLTDLLRSRTVDVEGHQKQRTEPNTLQPVVLKENGAQMQTFTGDISAPAVSSTVLEDDIASPAELAKVYMGRRSSRIAPSPLGLHSQAFREDAVSLSNAPFPLKSSCTLLAPRSAVRFGSVSGVSENSYLTPTRHGRSAIYSMARTPYSRVSNYAALKSVESPVDANVGPSSPQWLWENNILSGGKQVSKRRSSVLDSDIGSVGPIRRIRRKTNMISPSKSSGLPISGTPLSSATAVSTDVAQASAASNRNLLLLDETKHNNTSSHRLVENLNKNIPDMRFASVPSQSKHNNTSSHRLVENLNKSIPDMRFASVPSQSNEMAQKILQQLDKLVPSPKEKSAELKLAASMGKSPTKLTPSMLQGQALKSMEDVDSSKLPNNIQSIDTSNGLGGAHVPDFQNSSPPTHVRVGENGPTKVSSLGVKLASEANGLVTKSAKETLHSVDAEPVISNFVSNLPQKKRAFQISAQDFLDFDDCTYKEKLDSSVTLSKVNDDRVNVEKHGISSSETKPTAISTSKTMKDVGTSEVLPAAKKDTGFTFAVTHAPSTLSEPALPTVESPSLFNKPAPPKQSTFAPVFSVGSNSLNKAAPFTFSSASATSESSIFKVGVHSESKLETSTSAASASRMTEATSSASEMYKGNKDKPQYAGNLFREEEGVPPFSSASTTQLFSFGASMSNSSPKNDSFSSATSLFSVPASSTMPSGSANNTIFSSPSTHAASAETTKSTVSVSTVSTFSHAPAFQFGSGTSASAQSNSVSLPSATTAVDSAGPGLKAQETPSFSSPNSFSFGVTPPFATGTGTGTFVFGASAPSTTISTTSANNVFQSSNTGNATSGSLSFTQAASGTGNVLFTQSMPMQFGSTFGSTASKATFGSTGTSPFSSGSTLFSSSSSGANPFGTSSGFGMSSSMMTSTGTSSFSFGSGAASSVSGSSSQSASSSIFSSGFGSATPATGFSFGLSSATAGTAGSAPVPFGSSVSASSGSFFSFTSATSTTTPPLSPAFPSFGLTPVPTMGTVSPGNDQMNMEDSMAEDTVQAPSPVAPVFGQPANTPSPSNFAFGNPAPSGGPQSFQFGSQQNSLTPQTPSPFQAPNSLEFAAGGSFSLGTGGGDKSNRRTIKVSRTRPRKK